MFDTSISFDLTTVAVLVGCAWMSALLLGLVCGHAFAQRVHNRWLRQQTSVLASGALAQQSAKGQATAARRRREGLRRTEPGSPPEGAAAKPVGPDCVELKTGVVAPGGAAGNSKDEVRDLSGVPSSWDCPEYGFEPCSEEYL